MRIFAVGDVHGCAVSLETLLQAVPLEPEDLMIFLGDYVDRGPATCQVIEQLLELRVRRSIITLQGNHEIMMLEAGGSRSNMAEWRRYGGDATLASYQPHTLAAVPETHWGFLDGCLPYYETEDHLFVHARVLPDRALADQPDSALFWEHLTEAAPHYSGKTVICGHTAQHSGEVLDLGAVICLDTYAHGGGWLTCLEVGTGRLWQANEQGETKWGELS